VNAEMDTGTTGSKARRLRYLVFTVAGDSIHEM
jgi:hypothetical protein